MLILKKNLLSIFILIFLNNFCVLLSQTAVFDTNEQFIFNGKEFVNTYNTSSGSPFLKDNLFLESRIIFRGRTYDKVLLNYDVYNQKFVTEYTNSWGGKVQLQLASPFVDTVFLRNEVFIFNKWDSISESFLSVMGMSEKKGFFKKYSKAYKISTSQGGSNYEFSALKDEFFYFNGKILYKITGIRKLKSIVSHKAYEKIKLYCREKNVTLKKATARDFDFWLRILNSEIDIDEN